MWGVSVYFTRNLSESWYWIVHDRQGGTSFRKHGVGSTSTGSKGAAYASSSGSSNSLLNSGHSRHTDNSNPFQTLDEFDEDTDAFVAEL